MADFTGFRFGPANDETSRSEYYHVLRVSDGSRYSENLLPTFNDSTADMTSSGVDGTMYFNTYYKSRQFNISIAFDEVREEDIRRMRKWLNGIGVKELVFDEEPHKVYRAKVTGSPTIKYICFENDSGDRIYKGEGSITFTAFYPFAMSTGTFGEDIINDGDVDAPFVLQISPIVPTSSIEVTMKDSNNQTISTHTIAFHESGSSSIDDVEWNSKTGMIRGEASGTTRPLCFTGNSLVTIPVGAKASVRYIAPTTDEVTGQRREFTYYKLYY